MLQFADLAIAYVVSLLVNPGSDDDLTIATGKGALFPEAGNGRIFIGMIEDPGTGNRELVKCTTHAAGADTFKVSRGYGGTAIYGGFTSSSIFRLVASKDAHEASLRRGNRIINGCMRLWDYGTSSASPADGVFVANRWRVGYSAAVGTNAISRVAATLGEWEYDNPPKYWLRWNQTVAPVGTALLRQPIESVHTCAGGTVTVSFKAKAGAGTPEISVRLIQKFGTGGAPSGDVSTSFIDFTLSTTPARYQATFALSSLSGKTLGSNGDDHLLLEILMGDAATFDVYITDVQVERTSTASDFIPRHISEERALAQRYFWKTFDNDTAPASSAGTSGALGYVATIAAAVANGVQVRYPVPMRASPTLTFYNPSAAGAAWRNTSGGTDSGAVATSFASNRGVLVQNPQVGGDGVGNLMAVHMTAQSEL